MIFLVLLRKMDSQNFNSISHLVILVFATTKIRLSIKRIEQNLLNFQNDMIINDFRTPDQVLKEELGLFRKNIGSL